MQRIQLPREVEAALSRASTEAEAHRLHEIALELGGRPGGEWTFPVFVFRGVAAEDPVLSFFYEPLRTWEETLFALRIRAALEEDGVGEELPLSVILGFEVFDSAFLALGGRLTLPGPDDPFRGRHSVAAERVVDAETVAFGNSWGGHWGDGGIGYMSREYFEAHVDSVFVTRPSYAGLSPAMDQDLYERAWRAGRPGRTAIEDWQEAWRSPNPRLTGSVDVRGRRHERWRRSVLSFTANTDTCEIYEILSEDQSVGRFHLRHSQNSQTAVLEELWVPPSVRGRGYGSVLEAEATSLARWMGLDEVSLPLFEADAYRPNRELASAFAESKGYEWAWQAHRRPNVIGVARKPLSPPSDD